MGRACIVGREREREVWAGDLNVGQAGLWTLRTPTSGVLSGYVMGQAGLRS